MILADTHTHLYLPHFKNDTDKVVHCAIENGVQYMFLPNIDNKSVDPMLQLAERYPRNCFPMLGLHPNSVADDFENELKEMESRLNCEKICAIGETGIDLYRSRKTLDLQKESLKIQLEWAVKNDLPVVLHTRNSFEEVFGIISKYFTNELKGVFHSFTGNKDQAARVAEVGFSLGIGGIATFKNTELLKVLECTEPDNIVLETDAPYLAPHPFRGKRNESSYLTYIAEKVAEVYSATTEKVAEITTSNALKLFNKISLK